MFIFSYFSRLFHLEFYINVVKGVQRFNPFLSLFIVCLVWVTKPTIILYTQGYAFAQEFESQVSTLINRIYPDELEVQIKNGVVSTNVQEPYYVTVSPETFKGTFLEDKNRTSDYKQRILAIDTKGRAEDFERYQSSALLTDRSLVYYNDNKIRIQPLRETESLYINKARVQEGFNKLTTEIKMGRLLRVGVIVLPFLLLLLLYIGQWIALLWFSLLIWVIMKIHLPGSSYGRSIRYTAAVMFLPGLLTTVISAIPNLPAYVSTALSYSTLAVFAFAYLGIYYAAHPREEASQ